jgi:hypothetical protein
MEFPMQYVAYHFAAEKRKMSTQRYPVLALDEAKRE